MGCRDTATAASEQRRQQQPTPQRRREDAASGSHGTPPAAAKPGTAQRPPDAPQRDGARCSLRTPAVASQQCGRISNRCAAPAARRQQPAAWPTPAAAARTPKYAGRSTAAPAPLAARRAKDDAPIIKSHRYTRAGGGHPPRPRSWGAGAPCFCARRVTGGWSWTSRAKTYAPSAPPASGAPPPPARRSAPPVRRAHSGASCIGPRTPPGALKTIDMRSLAPPTHPHSRALKSYR